MMLVEHALILMHRPNGQHLKTFCFARIPDSHKVAEIHVPFSQRPCNDTVDSRAYVGTVRVCVCGGGECHGGDQGTEDGPCATFS